MSDLIYKILRPAEWQQAQAAESFEGAPVDFEDGYIHFSTATQVAETARRYFADCEILHVLAIDPWQLPVGTLRWEPSRGGELFPHLYAALPMKTMVQHWALERKEDGQHDFSGVLPETPQGGAA